MNEGRWGFGVGFSPAARPGVRPPPPKEDIKLSNRFTFSDELEEAIGEAEVPILGEVAGLEPAKAEVDATAMNEARRAFEVAQNVFERARMKERRYGQVIPKSITKEYFDTYEVFDRESAKYSWAKAKLQAGDDGSIQLSHANRFSKGFTRHP